MTGTLSNPVIGEPNSTGDPKIIALVKQWNEKINSENKLIGTNIEKEGIGNEQLSSAAKPFDWYTPKIIPSEQERTNTAFGTLTTADEITGVVLPENGLIVVGYQALWKSSVSAAGKAAIFIGANQLKTAASGAPAVNEISTLETKNSLLTSIPNGLTRGTVESTSFVTTGQAIATGSEPVGGVCFIYAAAGTYNISVQFKASSGTVTAKERKLWVAVLGV
jgi:hypothetical protein